MHWTMNIKFHQTVRRQLTQYHWGTSNLKTRKARGHVINLYWQENLALVVEDRSNRWKKVLETITGNRCYPQLFEFCGAARVCIPHRSLNHYVTVEPVSESAVQHRHQPSSIDTLSRNVRLSWTGFWPTVIVSLQTVLACTVSNLISYIINKPTNWRPNLLTS